MQIWLKVKLLQMLFSIKRKIQYAGSSETNYFQFAVTLSFKMVSNSLSINV
jgi:hypothetical protein